ncbi:uncharacterized protein LOC127420693 isoform X2 [Xyrichtys novacula]|uniref:Uncharacterized protein LOC127420693 isoform X2 n=1 Tax=Xyrichtys novacula TaxID=13765 RepID=A0AAV1HMJ1_XYRNO|nr:uncharacterized protein LOC127420693 isoform X2 [Xyrichtys novacula]
MIWRCFICYVFVALTLKKLLSHVNSLHSRSPDFRVVCGIDGCPNEYRVYNSYYYHIKRTHAHHLHNGALGPGDDEATSSPGTHQETTDSIVNNSVAEDSTHTDTTQDCSSVTEDNSFRDTQTRAVNQMVNGVQQYQAALLDHLKHQMNDMIERHSGNLDQLKSDAMDIFDQFSDPFSDISTTYLQDKKITELLQPVEAELVVLKNSACYVKRGDARVLAIKSHYFHYIPLLESLGQLLLHPRILEMIEEGPQPCKYGFVYDFIDGDIFKVHPLFSKFPKALQLIVYTDEIDLCNINPKYRSRLAAIRLLAMVKSKDLSNIDKIFQRLNHDLNELYVGAKVFTANGEQTIYGAVMAVCGDTLAQHEVAGFKEGVGFAYSKCRHCECNFEDMQEQFNEDLFVKRTMASHIRQCCNIERASTNNLKEKLKTTYGVNRRSKLTEFPGFNLITQTPEDIMHIILQGVAPY